MERGGGGKVKKTTTNKQTNSCKGKLRGKKSIHSE